MPGGYFRQGIPVKLGSLTLVSLLVFYIVLTSWKIQGFYLHWEAFVKFLHSNQLSSLLNIKNLNKSYLHFSARLHIVVLGIYLPSSSTLLHYPPIRVYLPLGLIYPFLDFQEIHLMPPVATVRYSGTFYFSSVGGGGGIEGGNVHQSEDLILTRFISQDIRVLIFFERISMGDKCCVKLRLVSGEGLTISHCEVKIRRIRRVTPPPPHLKRSFLFR